MPATPDRPVPPKIAANFGLRGLRDRLRGRRSQIPSPNQTDASPTWGWATPKSDRHYDFPASPAAVEPLTPSGESLEVRAPPPPAVRPGWAQLPSPHLPPPSPAFFSPAVPSGGYPIPPAPTIPLVFAVDVSGSTAGRILAQEQDAIALIASKLEPKGPGPHSCVIPWDSHCQGIVPTSQARYLVPGAGTNPSVVLESPSAKQVLKEANLWFLMTDGYIEKPLITKFADAISSTGMHGTASVIILFGYRSRSPFECNVSVGMSVFAVAPHCIFLFHDVKRAVVYVLQAKGAFATLLPEQARFTPFGPMTRWEDLTRISYDDLAKVDVPSPTHLSQDTVVLPGGKTFDMRSIYSNSLSKEDTIELLADYSALDVILLAAKTRGKDASVKAWIEDARRYHKMPEPAQMKRDDVDQQASNAMRSLLQEVQALVPPDSHSEELWNLISQAKISQEGDDPNVPDFSARFGIRGLRRTLRIAHHNNWTHFESMVNADSQLSSRLQDTLTEVLSTMSMNDHRPPASPAMLTPMSSPAPMDPTDMGSYSMTQRMSPLSPQVQSSAFTPDNSYGSSWQQPRTSLTKDLLFLPGFKGSRRDAFFTNPGAYGTCPICQDVQIIQTLLLQASSEESETLHLPKKNQRAGHKYPLVLGNYPETDVILPITACDGCAAQLLEAGELQNGDRVTVALPLVPLLIPDNRKLWEEKLSEVYGHRFHHSNVFLVFLSTLCTTLEDLADGEIQSSCETLKPALEWSCEELSRLPGISTRAGLTPIGSPLSGVVDDRMPLHTALRVAFSGLSSTMSQSPLLAYPIDGFLVLVRLAGLMEDNKGGDIERFVWRRLLYYFTEQHVELQTRSGLKEAREMLRSLIYQDAGLETPANSATGKRRTISLSSLKGTYLIPTESDILDQFQRTGKHFSDIINSEKYVAVLAVFLHIMFTLTEGSTQIWAVEDFSVKIQYRAERLSRMGEGLVDIFFDGTKVDEDMAGKLIQAAYSMPTVPDVGLFSSPDSLGRRGSM